MASVDIEIAGRAYPVACRDGEEAHLRSLASVVDRKAREAAGALGSMGETRQFLFASLLLADELNEARGGNVPAYEPPQPAPDVADALERLAGRMEKLAEQLESRG